jgi:hypothetical protein
MANVYLDETNVDDLGRIVTTLLSEMWIMRDRMLVMEELLSRQGILDSATIDAFDWPAEQADRVETLRDQMVGSVLGAPLGARERHVDQMLARAGYARPA